MSNALVAQNRCIARLLGDNDVAFPLTHAALIEQRSQMKASTSDGVPLLAVANDEAIRANSSTTASSAVLRALDGSA